MNPSSPSTLYTLYSVRNSRIDYFERIDEISEVINQICATCPCRNTENAVWRMILEKCLEHSMPETFQLKFEKLIEAFS